MYLLLGLAAAAIGLVLSYNHRESAPQLAGGWVSTAQQLAGVILTLCRAAEGLLHALDHPAALHTTSTSTAGSRRITSREQQPEQENPDPDFAALARADTAWDREDWR